MKTFVISLLIVLVVAGGLVTAAYGAGPGEPMAALGRGIESFRLSLIGRTEDPSRLQIAALQERIADSQELVLNVDNNGTTVTLDDRVTPEPIDDDWSGPEERYVPWGDGYCDGTATEPHPVLTKLAEHFAVSYDELLVWYCDGWTSGQIAIAYTLSQETGVPVADIFAMRESGLNWREILVKLGYDPDIIFPPILIDPEPYCNGTATDQHPGVVMLAELLGVPYEEVLGWVCEGWSLREVTFAYQVSGETGVPVADLFAMRESGKSWDEILVELGLDPEVYIAKPMLIPNPGERICMDEAVHPLAARIAEELGVALDEVKQLFCSGMDLSEIRQHFGVIGNPAIPEGSELPARPERPVLPVFPRRAP